MFNFFNRKKKVKVLVVVDNDSSVPIDYYNVVDVNLVTEIKAACNALAIPAAIDTIDSIADVLRSGETYWLEKTWGFQVIEVEV